MATAAQIEANRLNAKSSTGPQTATGKQTSSSNAEKHGLFSTKTFIRDDEQLEYQEMCAGIIASLSPVGHLEDMLAVEIVRCAWRLRRCGNAEAHMVEWTVKEERKRRAHFEDPTVRRGDPSLYDDTSSAQAIIDRARTQALASQRRAMADLADLQTERLLREQLVPGDADHSSLGLARVKQIQAASGSVAITRKWSAESEVMAYLSGASPVAQQENATLAETIGNSREQGEPGENTERTQSESEESLQSARNAPCPCNSGLKYKRCCGQNAPPVLGAAA